MFVRLTTGLVCKSYILKYSTSTMICTGVVLLRYHRGGAEYTHQPLHCSQCAPNTNQPQTLAALPSLSRPSPPSDSSHSSFHTPIVSLVLRSIHQSFHTSFVSHTRLEYHPARTIPSLCSLPTTPFTAVSPQLPPSANSSQPSPPRTHIIRSDPISSHPLNTTSVANGPQNTHKQKQHNTKTSQANAPNPPPTPQHKPKPPPKKNQPTTPSDLARETLNAKRQTSNACTTPRALPSPQRTTHAVR
ncbi:hypothetical protein EJ03DRAFT_195265 [Teratosphaeria nubilosa]|uniref:Uncharacterized protein n=1 Tax=Teratosphaeria nubilosa TaxID=161662 RepID=A0A6G1L107_9PEZI|nr:hypothetical protein EJ03DRAFT_195265 [Teratosphaeria nubilosa]